MSTQPDPRADGDALLAEAEHWHDDHKRLMARANMPFEECFYYACRLARALRTERQRDARIADEIEGFVEAYGMDPSFGTLTDAIAALRHEAGPDKEGKEEPCSPS